MRPIFAGFWSRASESHPIPEDFTRVLTYNQLAANTHVLWLPASPMTEKSPNVRLVHVKHACEDCRVRKLCLPVSLDSPDIQNLNQLVKRRPPLKKGEFLYRAGDRFRSIFAVQIGALKTYGITADGVEQVTGFHLSGELVGLDAINDEVHPCNAVALENTWVCELPYDDLSSLAQKVPGLQREIMRIMSREIRSDADLLMLVGKVSAEVRLMRFLNNLHQRMSKRLGNVDEIHLPMTREDIASYLGLTPETVSRVLARLRGEGLITINNRRIKFIDLGAMKRLAAC
jgi:CRP/FNR family transcriptional regulator, anaerobic regulatory protein